MRRLNEKTYIPPDSQKYQNALFEAMNSIKIFDNKQSFQIWKNFPIMKIHIVNISDVTLKNYFT